MKKLDKIDKKILDILQKDADITTEQLAKQVNLSKVPCWKRLKYLKDHDYIQSTVAVLNKKKFNLNIEVFVQIQTIQHNSTWLDNFSRQILSNTSVISFYRTAGNIDYIIHTIHENASEYDNFYKELIQMDGISNVSALIIMQDVKQDHSIAMS